MTGRALSPDPAETPPAAEAGERPAPIADDLAAQRSARAALWVFVAFVVVAFPFVLFRLGDYHWFFRDDFFFITDRSLTSPSDLLRPHNTHWSTIPVIAFGALWKLFGLRSYVPYQASVLLLHLTAAVLLRVIMRRAGVGPWLATAFAGVFVLFGPGSENIVWAFQIGFTGSLVFGLTQLVLADHEGPSDRHTGLALGSGLLALIVPVSASRSSASSGWPCWPAAGWRIGAHARRRPLGGGVPSLLADRAPRSSTTRIGASDHRGRLAAGSFNSQIEHVPGPGSLPGAGRRASRCCSSSAWGSP